MAHQEDKPIKFNPRKNLVGEKIGRLTVLEYSHKGGSTGRTYYYKCKCECGNTCVKSSAYLLRDERYAPHKSCGCWHRELSIKASTKHGLGNTKNPTFKTWIEIKLRCNNPNNRGYKDYGGRGIKVCDRWCGEHGFENFLADMGERPGEGYSIDRIDNNGNYEPSNCRWATIKQQCNNRRSNINITYNGKTQTLKQWCDEFGLNYSNTRLMIRKTGRSFEYTLNYQLNKKKKHVQSRLS